MRSSKSALAALLFVTLLIGPHARAEEIADPRQSLREVEVELEAVEGIESYEIEITPAGNSKKGSKSQLFSTRTPIWRAELKPGRYTMRVRLVDERGIRGKWGDADTLIVKLPSVELSSPKKGEQIVGAGPAHSVRFEWERQPWAVRYQLEVKRPTGETVKTLSTEDGMASVELPTSQLYEWRVTPVTADGEAGDAPETGASFTLYGPKIEMPKIIAPPDPFVRELTWRVPEGARLYKYTLHRQKEDGSWQSMGESESWPETKVGFDEMNPGGAYRLTVQASAPLRETSEVASLEFQVHYGARTPEAIEEFYLRKSMERRVGYKALASYLITNMSYFSQNKETNTRIDTQALGGTGRLGLGYQVEASSWGTFGIIDASGFTIDSKTMTFLSGEWHASWYNQVNFRTQLQLSSGLYYKELPETIGFSSGGGLHTETLASAGPHIGFDLRYAVTSRLALIAQGRAYQALVGVKTPSGGAIQNTLSYQMGMLGALRLTNDLIGHAGYTYRVDNAGYEAKPGNPLDPNTRSIASPGDRNTVSVTGHYLQLSLEYGF